MSASQRSGEMTKTIIDGVEVKIGDTIAYTQWLSFERVVVDIPKKNVLKIANSKYDVFPETLVKGRKYWTLNGRHGVCVNLCPDHNVIEAHNNAIRNSESWMCM